MKDKETKRFIIENVSISDDESEDGNEYQYESKIKWKWKWKQIKQFIIIFLYFFLYSRVEKESPGDMCFPEFTVLDWNLSFK